MPTSTRCRITRISCSLVLQLIVIFGASAANGMHFQEKPLPSPAPKMIPINQNFGLPEFGKFLPKYVQSAAPTLPMIGSRIDHENKLNTVSNDIFPDSPIFYFRLPLSAPSPYMYLTEIENFMNHIHHPPAFVPYNMIPSSVPIHLPIPFTSNGKPNSIYQYPQHDVHSMKPSSKPPDSKPAEKPNVVNLNKGPYNLNGKPTDIYLLQDSFNSLFSHSLSGLYP